MGFGHTHRPAPELRVPYWIDGQGNEMENLSLTDLGEGYKLIYCFQNWCPGCHSFGFPALKKLVAALGEKGFGFAVVQTVFEGAEQNTRDRLREMQLKYGINLPFGHDVASGDAEYPTVMEDFRTGGTPWFILIDPKGEIIFSDFRLNPEQMIEAFETGEAVELSH